MSSLGPPPPYRPIVRVGATFERGPAPDLEPWRLASLARMPTVAPEERPETTPVSADLDDADWTLPREPEPEIHGDMTAHQEARVEIGPGLALNQYLGADPRDLPIVDGPYVPPTVGRGRRIRPLLWAAGALIVLLVLCGGLVIERNTVIRAFPPAFRVYAALGLATVPQHGTAPVPDPKCAGRPGCADAKPGAPAK